MKRLICAILALAICGTAAAQQPVLVVSASGYHLLTQDAAGKPVLTEVTNVVRLGEASPNPPPPPPGSLRETVQRLAVAVNDPTTARALAKVYELVRDSVSAGTIDHSRAFAAVSAATDLVLREQSAAAAWQPWRKALGDELAKLQQEGKLSTKADYVRVLNEIHEGLMGSTAQAGLLDNIDWERLIRLIELIIRLIGTFGAQGAAE